MTNPPTTDQPIPGIESELPYAMAAWLYGSAPTGSMNAESDSDVAVLLPFSNARKTSWSLKAQTQALTERWDRKVDLVSFSASSWVPQKEILMAGKPLFSKNALFVGNAELQTFSRYREFNERNAPEFERIAHTGKVYA